MPSVKKQKTKSRKQNISRSTRAGLLLPVGRIHRQLRKGKYSDRIGKDAPVCLAAVLEYLVNEIMDLAGNPDIMKKKKRISPRHILMAVQTDDELAAVFKNVTIPQGGVLPHIEAVLQAPKKVKPKSTNEPEAPTNSQMSDSEDSGCENIGIL